MTTAASPERTISVTDAARALGLSPATVRNYCRSGLVGEFDERTGWYFLSKEEIRFLRKPENRPQVGRPPATSDED